MSVKLSKMSAVCHVRPKLATYELRDMLKMVLLVGFKDFKSGFETYYL